MKRTTIARPVTTSGIGVHTGQLAQVTLKPSEKGLQYQRIDGKPQTFTVTAEAVEPTPLCTLLTNASGATLSTVEHLMAPLHVLGITDLFVEIDGPEMPILDGSSLPWLTLLDQAGRTELESEIDPITFKKPIDIQINSSTFHVQPSTQLSLDVSTDFPHAAIGPQRWHGTLTEATFRTQIAPARTFILEKELKQVQQLGFAKGAALTGGILFLDNGKIANPEGLRFPDEPVRHKVLDAVGDLYMAARPVLGQFILQKPGHSANNALLRTLLGA